MNLLQALYQRALQEQQAMKETRIGVGPDPNSGKRISDIPVVGGIPGVAGALRPSLAGLHALGLLMEGSGSAAKAVTGGGAAALGGYLGAVADIQHKLDPTMPGREAIPQALQQAGTGFQQANGDPLMRALAANEAGARGNERAFGLANLALDPLNYATPAAKAPGLLGAAGRLGSMVNDVSVAAPLLPFVLRKNLAQQAAREAKQGGLQKLLDTPLSAEAADAATARATAAATEPRMVRPAPQAMVPRMVRPAPQNQVSRLVRAAPQTGIPPLPPEVLQREPTFAYGPPTTLQEAAQRLGISQRPSQAPNTPLELLMAAQGTVKPPTPLRTPPTPTGPLSVPVGTLDDFNALLAGPWASSRYLPPAEAFAKRLNVPVAQAQGWLDDLVSSGAVGRLPDGELAFKPGVPQEATVAARSAVRDMSGLDLTPSTDAITPAQERLARLANGGVDQPARALGTAPDFPAYTDRASGIAALTPDEIDTLVNVAYPTSDAQGSAIAKYGNPADLASRAVERIQTQPGLAERLSGIDDKLARKIALLPEPAGAALPDMARVPESTGAGLTHEAFTTQYMDALKGTLGQAAQLERAMKDAALGKNRALEDALWQIDNLEWDGKITNDEAGRLADAAYAQHAPGKQRPVAALPDMANVDIPTTTGATPAISEPTPAVSTELPPSAPTQSVRDNPLVWNRDEYIAQRVGEIGPKEDAQFAYYFPVGTGGSGGGRKGMVGDRSFDALATARQKAGAEWDAALRQKRANKTPLADSSWNLRLKTVVKRSGATTPEDIAAVTQQHQDAVMAAIKARKMVPDGVLQDHLDAIRAAKKAPPPGGDIAAGGGGGGGSMGLLPYPSGLTGPIGRAIVPAAGAGAGAGIGYLTGDNPEDARANALKGAAIGGALGAGVEWSPELARQVASLSQGTMYSPTMLKRMWDAGIAAQTEAANSKGVVGAGNLVKAAPGAWRAQAVNTIKQFPQDALTRLVTLWGIARKELGVTGDDIRYWQELIATERATGTSNLANPLTDILRRAGLQRLIPQLHEVFGIDFVTSEAARAGTKMSANQSAVMGAAFAVANGLRTLNPLSAALGAVKGRFQPFINGFVHFGNGVQHGAFRGAMGEKTLQRDLPALGKALIADLQARGVDVSSLVAKGDIFSGDDVAKVAGAKLGTQWDTLLEETVRNGGDRIAFLAGDFREASKYKFEDKAGKVFPFIRWPLHYGPVLAEVAANNPRLAAVAAGLLAAQQEEAKQGGLKAYERLSTPITTETPVLGALARARLGGQSGTVRLNLPGSVLPYTQLLGGVEMPQGDTATGYEKAKSALGAAGMSPNPLIQAGAYVLGQDYQSPGALSRTAGLEALPRLLPGAAGRLEMPGVGTLLDTTRQFLAPATGAHTSEYDPTYRRYAELVLQTTKKPLSDAANQHYLLQDTEAAQALYQQAEREVVLAGAAGNVYSLTSPISATARGEAAQAAQTAKAGVPFDRARIDASTSGTLQELMRATNDRYSQANPAVNTYAVSNPTDAKYTILRQWEASPNAVWLKYNAPSAYTRAKKSLAELLGLTTP